MPRTKIPHERFSIDLDDELAVGPSLLDELMCPRRVLHQAASARGKSFTNAAVTIAGIELAHRIRKK